MGGFCLGLVVLSAVPLVSQWVPVHWQPRPWQRSLPWGGHGLFHGFLFTVVGVGAVSILGASVWAGPE